ncbi:hypothetical protein ACIRRA_44320 [Nocardia sp. NPDC101769]|uniref:hypothetical protein n=1 Tax=Nocardia sp. NPDC101769 TaxID=3364333 RepID=UPI0037FF2029
MRMNKFERRIARYNDRSTAAFEAGNPSRALRYNDRALALLAALGATGEWDVASAEVDIYLNRSTFLHKLGRTAEAIAAARSALAILTDLGALDDPVIIGLSAIAVRTVSSPTDLAAPDVLTLALAAARAKLWLATLLALDSGTVGAAEVDALGQSALAVYAFAADIDSSYKDERETAFTNFALARLIVGHAHISSRDTQAAITIYEQLLSDCRRQFGAEDIRTVTMKVQLAEARVLEYEIRRGDAQVAIAKFEEESFDNLRNAGFEFR